MQRTISIISLIAFSLTAIAPLAHAKDIGPQEATYSHLGEDYIVLYKYSNKNQWRWADIRYASKKMPNLMTPELVSAASDADIQIVQTADKALRAFLSEQTCIKGVLTQKMFDKYDTTYEFIPRRPMSVMRREDAPGLVLGTAGLCQPVGGWPDSALSPKELKRRRKTEARAAKAAAKAEANKGK